MEPMEHSMSHLFYNQVDQIADVKTCKINDVEQRYYKVQWKCTWEPEIILEKFCGKIIDNYNKHPVRTNQEMKIVNIYDKSIDTLSSKNECLVENQISSKDTFVQNIDTETNFKYTQISSNQSNAGVHNAFDKNKDRLTEVIGCRNELVLDIKSDSDSQAFPNVLSQSDIGCRSEILLDIKSDPDGETFPSVNICNESNVSNLSSQVRTPDMSMELNGRTLPESNQLQKNVGQIQINTNFVAGFENTSQDSAFILNSRNLLDNVSIEENDLAAKGYMNSNQSLDKRRLIENEAKINHNQNFIRSSMIQLDEGITPDTSIMYRTPTEHGLVKITKKCYKCQLCSYSSLLNCNLKRHMLKHTGEKPLKCNLCSYSTAHNHNLKLHLAKHTGVKPFSCQECSYATTIQCNLKTHLRTHRREGPFKCNKCSYSSFTDGVLKRHIIFNHTDSYWQ